MVVAPDDVVIVKVLSVGKMGINPITSPGNLILAEFASLNRIIVGGLHS